MKGFLKSARNSGGIETTFETYTRYFGVDSEGQKRKVLGALKGKFLINHVGGGHIFFYPLKMALRKKLKKPCFIVMLIYLKSD